ncbi:CoB--CoM heterodisulfide reductase iron-sulfur subunit B family protein [Desulfitobacterium metallireducens]|uniref:Disulfide reductase n=1 Tax=Desulfitobacterium metallireducens DSM 15288 TaxID=871968 RepID=W0EBW9_9FIRM|nr:CoB--CoM heterodisulfide reductase iron-sulfur subunit B family protein [Desulfitobacterium metallireducens]AHF06571.1 disulfide reductase [Desulfitobacterium metallireducens DSM 15288]
MPRLDKVAQIPKPKQIFFFKSCVASNKYPGIESCGKEALEILGVEPVESDEQTCCGGFVTFANVAAPTASMPAVARNLALAEEKNLDTCVLCNGCWTFLNEFGHFMAHNEEIKTSINMMMNMMGREFKGTSNVYHIAEMFYRLKDDIAKNVKRPLTGVKIATHYGCHYLGGGKYSAIDDAQMPTYMEELIELMGGTVVPYTANRECCGTGFTQIINGKDLSLEHTQHKLDSVNEADPDLLIVQCPYCHSQLDRVQQQLNYRQNTNDYQTPVIHIAQLVGLALGLDLPKLAFAAHISGRERLEKVLDKIGR